MTYGTRPARTQEGHAMTMKITEGMLVVAGNGIGRVHRVGKRARANGAWIFASTGDGASMVRYPSFAPDWCITPAVIGKTVCATPRYGCFCGLTHVSAEELRWLHLERTRS